MPFQITKKNLEGKVVGEFEHYVPIFHVDSGLVVHLTNLNLKKYKHKSQIAITNSLINNNPLRVSRKNI